MTLNRFRVACVWKDRGETPEDLGVGALRSLDAIGEICPFCESWEVVDRIAQRMMPLEKHRSAMTELVLQGVSRDNGEADPWYGYRVIANNGASEPQKGVGIWFTGACTSPTDARGSAQFETEYFHSPGPTIVSPNPAIIAYPVFYAILRTLVRIWRPDHAVAYSRALAKLNLDPGIIFGAAWMTYLSPALATQVAPPATIPVERDPDGGLFMIAAKETFDAANPTHLAGAQAIRDAVAPLNPPPAQPWRPEAVST